MTCSEAGRFSEAGPSYSVWNACESVLFSGCQKTAAEDFFHIQLGGQQRTVEAESDRVGDHVSLDLDSNGK